MTGDFSFDNGCAMGKGNRMKKIFGNFVVALVASPFVLAPLIFIFGQGCLTDKTSSVTATTNTQFGVTTTNYATNTVVTVNSNALALDCAGIQSLTGLGVSVAIQEDPKAKQIIQNIQTALSGVLNGAGTNTVLQIQSLIGSSGNAAVTSNLAPVVNSLSSLEQTLVKKYGATVGGQIGLALATAVNVGITAGL
jgi:hypothetical protein